MYSQGNNRIHGTYYMEMIFQLKVFISEIVENTTCTPLHSSVSIIPSTTWFL